MRQVEMSGHATQQTATTNANPTLSYEERKKLLRVIANEERKVTKLEEEIRSLETRMADPEFYQLPDSQKIMKTYQEKKTALDQAMEAWEEAQLTFEEYDTER